MAKYPTIYQGDDISIEIGSFYLDTDTDKTNPIDLTQFKNIIIRTGTDVRYTVEAALDPDEGQGQLVLSTNYKVIMKVESEQTLLMKEGIGIIVAKIQQEDNSLVDLTIDSSGEVYAYEIKAHSL